MGISLAKGDLVLYNLQPILSSSSYRLPLPEFHNGYLYVIFGCCQIGKLSSEGIAIDNIEGYLEMILYCKYDKKSAFWLELQREFILQSHDCFTLFEKIDI